MYSKIYIMFMQNSKSYWKILLGYVTLLILFEISVFSNDYTTRGIILSVAYVVFLWIITMWLTVVFLKKLFTNNKFLNWKFYDKPNVTIKDNSNIQPRHQLVQCIQKQFIENWYQEISKDETFTDECKIFLENTLKMFVDVVSFTDKTHLSYVVENIFLRHIKEFRRTMKLKEKNDAKISQFYRYSYSTINTQKSRDYYIHQMTKNVLVNFVHWDLWNSLPCQLVVSIISKKLSYLMELFSNPDFLNYYLLKTLISQEQIANLNLDKYSFIKIDVKDDKTEHRKKKISCIIIEEERIHQDESVSKSGDQKDLLLPEEKDEAVADFKYESTPIKKMKTYKADVAIEPCSDQVKVYEPKSTSKTWDELLDFETITLGEDPLGSSNSNDSFEGEIIQNDDIVSGDATVSTLRDIKDFQESTVNTVVKPMSHATSQALHKFGDFQDEAAGVVEGLFDFGMAGLRKGLKLTGLQENSAPEGVLVTKAKNVLASPSGKNSDVNKKVNRYSKAEIAEECVWLNPLAGGAKTEEDVVVVRQQPESVPSILMDSTEYESPDPEYEEAADLATTIAKLRSLLQQKSSESTATTPVASPMVSEDSKTIMDLDEVDSFVPSFYKLCAKTATGVFNNTLNTIKTALPVNDEIITYDMDRWEYKDAEEQQVTLLTRMNKLLHDRRDFCTIETAYDAFDSQQPSQDTSNISDVNFQDELDEFESEVPLAKTALDIFCELIQESDTFISQEPFVKFILLVFGKSIDEYISTKVENLFNDTSITEIPIDDNQEVLNMDIDVFVNYLMSNIPDVLIFIIGHSTLRDALFILVSSIQVKKCNQDLILQIFEFISVRLKEDSLKTNSLCLAQ